MATAGWIEDRWLKKRPDPVTGKRERTDLWGTNTARYRVCGIPGVRRRSFKTLDEAKAWKATAITDTRRRQFIDERAGDITLADYIEQEWWPKRNDPVGTAITMRSKIWRHIINSSLGRQPLGSIGDDQLGAWVGELEARGLEPYTVVVIWNHLSSIFKSAVGKRISKNPCREADSDVRPAGPGETKARAWLATEALAIRAALPERYQIIPDLGVLAGLRQAETFGFSADDVDEDRMLIHLRRQLLWENSVRPYFKLPKGRKERDIPLSPRMLQAIRDHEEKFPPVAVTLPWHGPGNGGRSEVTVRLLATSWFKKRIHPSTYNQRSMKPALMAAGLIAPKDENGRWAPSRELMHHRFRHTYASVQLGAGEDVVSVSHWMGHASPLVTMKIYAHFMPDNGKRGRTAVDAWLS